MARKVIMSEVEFVALTQVAQLLFTMVPWLFTEARNDNVEEPREYAGVTPPAFSANENFGEAETETPEPTLQEFIAETILMFFLIAQMFEQITSVYPALSVELEANIAKLWERLDNCARRFMGESIYEEATP